jgi:hypothetical protein
VSKDKARIFLSENGYKRRPGRPSVLDQDKAMVQKIRELYATGKTDDEIIKEVGGKPTIIRRFLVKERKARMNGIALPEAKAPNADSDADADLAKDSLKKNGPRRRGRSSSLSDDRKEEIRTRYSEGKTRSEIADEFGEKYYIIANLLRRDKALKKQAEFSDFETQNSPATV